MTQQLTQRAAREAKAIDALADDVVASLANIDRDRACRALAIAIGRLIVADRYSGGSRIFHADLYSMHIRAAVRSHKGD